MALWALLTLAREVPNYRCRFWADLPGASFEATANLPCSLLFNSRRLSTASMHRSRSAENGLKFLGGSRDREQMTIRSDSNLRMVSEGSLMIPGGVLSRLRVFLLGPEEGYRSRGGWRWGWGRPRGDPWRWGLGCGGQGGGVLIIIVGVLMGIK
jgi:hypothetical protein